MVRVFVAMPAEASTRQASYTLSASGIERATLPEAHMACVVRHGAVAPQVFMEY